METQSVLVKHLQEAKRSLAEPLSLVPDNDDDGGEVVRSPGTPVAMSQEMADELSSFKRFFED